MKFQILLIVLILNSVIALSQTVTSVTNGLWGNPATWDCTCVPVPGNTININHTVTISFDWAHSTGRITVGANGRLTQDATPRNFWIYGAGEFENFGEVNINFLVWENTVTPFKNYDTLYVRSIANLGQFMNMGAILNADSIYNNHVFSNGGKVEVSALLNEQSLSNSGVIVADSLTNAGSFGNLPTGVIEVDSLLNTGVFYNHGYISNIAFYNSNYLVNNNEIDFNDFTNAGYFENNNLLTGTGSLWNIGQFFNNSFGYLTLDRNFINGGAGTAAVFHTDGQAYIYDNWYNFDTIQGTSGIFWIEDTTYNAGYMLGSFDLCDYSPTQNFPFIDFNFGFISSNVSFCGTVGYNQASLSEPMKIYPNPAVDVLYIDFTSSAPVEMELMDMTGRTILKSKNKSHIDVATLPQGLYLLKTTVENRSEIQKVIIAR